MFLLTDALDLTQRQEQVSQALTEHFKDADRVHLNVVDRVRRLAYSVDSIERDLRFARGGANRYSPNARSTSGYSGHSYGLLPHNANELSSEELQSMETELKSQLARLRTSSQQEARTRVSELTVMVDKCTDKAYAFLEEPEFTPTTYALLVDQLFKRDAEIERLTPWQQLLRDGATTSQHQRVREDIMKQAELKMRSASFKTAAFEILTKASIKEALPEHHHSLVDMFTKNAVGRVLVYNPDNTLTTYSDKALEVKPDSSIYLIPAIAIMTAPWSEMPMTLAADDLSDADIETIATLFGGDAYSTLQEARDAAISLR